MTPLTETLRTLPTAVSRSTSGFLRAFLNAPQTVASVCPSTPAVQRAVCDAACVQSATNVIELGAGTGAITRALLAQLPNRGRVWAVEITPEFCQTLNTIDDHRLVVRQRSASKLKDITEWTGVAHADVIVSGIPFSTLDPYTAESIVRQAYECLNPGGRFVTYQLRDSVCDFANAVFGPAVDKRLVLASVPPLIVRCWKKSDQQLLSSNAQQTAR